MKDFKGSNMITLLFTNRMWVLRDEDGNESLPILYYKNAWVCGEVTSRTWERIYSVAMSTLPN